MQPQTSCCQLKLTLAPYLCNQLAAIDLSRSRNQQPNPSRAPPNGTNRSVLDSLCLIAYLCSPITVIRRTKQYAEADKSELFKNIFEFFVLKNHLPRDLIY